MNYRHAFHAGNFADVLKHAVLCRVLLHLVEKSNPFRVIETHAGAGGYDLAGEAASRTEEWREGIGRLIDHPPAGEAGNLLAPYLALVAAENKGGGVKHYPGSPLITRAFCREDDRMMFCELHPEEYAALDRRFRSDRNAKTAEIDGWTALKAYLPPKERRGLVLIDPPFEEPQEFERLCGGLAEGHRRWPTGIFLLWFPIKDRHEVRKFERRLAELEIPKILRIEFAVDKPRAEGPLSACGMMAVNPPWTLEKELNVILPALATTLGRNGAGRYRLDWLTPKA
ncbi:MAG TPA: 23S rRNA (adenine(2030)-N(6))-methyltransferase RlmJ [Xanthobacteraceae bacterium]|nr:23S rRNA (adenine(2030)-N(6))-methyltransferase RlmJ [Xanthobacteraceae bacterium]